MKTSVRTPLERGMRTYVFALFALATVLFGSFATQAFAQASGDYRSNVATGNWATAGSWQTFNGTTWVAAGAAPTTASGVVTILSGHTITVNTGTVTADQVVIAAGGQVNISSGATFVISNGTGTDLSVDGVLRNNGGTLTQNASTVMNVNAGGKYQQNFDGGVVPTANWAATSTIEVLGVTTSIGTQSAWGQSFGNMIWNCASQGNSTTNISFGGNLLTVQGDFTVISTGSSGGTLNFSNTGGNFTTSIAGNFNLQGGTVNFSNSGGATLGLNIGGNWNQTGGSFENVSSNDVGVNFTGTGKTFTLSSGTITGANVNFSVASGASLTLLNNLPVTTGQSCTVGGTLTMGTTAVTGAGAFTLSSGGSLVMGSPAGITSSGATGNVQVSGARSFNTGANYTYNGAAAQVTGAGLPATVASLTINNALGVTLTNASTTVSGATTLTAGALAVGANALIMSGTVSATGGSLTSAATGTVTYNQSGAGQTPLAMTYGNLNFSGGTKVLSAGTYGVAGAFTASPATGSTVTGSTFDFTSAGSQTIPPFNYNNVSNSGNGARTLANGGTVGIAGTFTPGAGAYTITNNTVSFNGSSAQTFTPAFTFNALTLANAGLTLGGNVAVNGALTLTSGALAIGSNTLTLNGATSVGAGSLSAASGTVIYNQGSAGQAVLATNYGNLTFSNFAKTLASTGTIGIAGTFTTGTVTSHTVTGSTVLFNGSTPQSQTGAFTYNNLTLNNAAGLTIGGNTTVNTTLTFTNGKLTTGANTLTLASTNATGAGQASGWVIGNLVRSFTTGASSRLFDIGDATSYAPVTVAMTGVASATNATVMAATTPGDHPSLAASGLDPANSANRYWTLTPNGSFPAFTSYDATFGFQPGDLDGGATPASFLVGRYVNPNWFPTTVGTRTATSTQATGITAFGDFAAAAPAAGSFTLTLSVVGGGTVSKSPDQLVYPTGTPVTLTATPATGWHFSAWSGDFVSSTNPDVVTMDADKSITATFVLDTHTVTATPDANGSVTLNPPGGSYNFGTPLTLTAVPNACYKFVTWGGDTTTTTNPLSIVVTRDRSLTATFALNTYTIIVTQGANGVIAPSGPLTLNCGDSQAFTITPNTHYHIVRVRAHGAEQGAVSSYTFNNVAANDSILATFALDQFSLATTIVGSGTTSRGAATLNLNYGTAVNDSATASAGYTFIGWTGDTTAANTPLPLVITRNRSLTANFQISTYTLTLNAVGNGTVSASPNQATYNHFTPVTVTATPDPGWAFYSWTSASGGDTTTTTNPLSLVMKRNRVLTAVFIPATLPFAQDFSSSAALSAYLIGGAATGGQFDAFATTSSGAVAYDAGMIRLTRPTFSNGTASFSRATDISNPTANALLYTFSFKDSGGAATTNAATLRVGAGFGTSASDESDANTFGRIGINTTSTSGQFQLRTAGGTNSSSFTGTQTITWVLNRTGGSLSYPSPAGGTAAVINNAMDVWVGTTLVFPGLAATTASAPLTDLKCVTANNSSFSTTNYLMFDNFNISAPVQYTLSVATVGSGSVAKSPDLPQYDSGSTVQLTATPDVGYQFSAWSGDATGSTNPLNVTMNANKNITATFTLQSFNIVASAGAGGSISPSGTVPVTFGTDQSFTITPNTCFHIADVLVDGVSQGPITNYTFTNVTAAHTIAASFATDTYTITAGAGVSPSGAVVVNCGGTQAFTFTPGICEQVSDITVDGSSVGAASSYTFTNVQANHTIDVTFVTGSPIITASAGSNGSISPSGPTTVACHGDQTFTFTPDACYQVASITIDGGAPLPAAPSYTFNDVTANHTIAVAFSQITYTLTASAGAGGTISPTNATTVNCGGTQAYTITPNACFAISDVLVDGVSVGAVATYTFTNVTANHTIAASFAATNYTITASATGPGAISPSGAVSVNCNANQTFTITANSCAHIADVVVDGVSQGAITSYTFTTVVANHTIAATFAADQRTIFAASNAGGTLSPTGTVLVNCGSDQTFTITPAPCYRLASVVVDSFFVSNAPTYTFTNVQATHVIEVTFQALTYTIDTNWSGPGTITPNGGGPFTSVPVNCGANQTFTFTPTTCNSIASVRIDGTLVPTAPTYTFTNVQESHTISVIFQTDGLTVTASAGANGAISPSGTLAVNCHDNPAYTITPAACFAVSDVLVDGVSVGAVTSYTFTDITASHTIAASFAPTNYTITASAGANGAISPDGATPVNCGANQAYTITPNSCFVVADVLVDGVSVGAVATYTFGNVTANHTIAASFAAATYTIVASANAGGSITPSGNVSVNCGGTQAFTIAADPNHHLADVLVDGSSVGAVTSYTFTNVQANHTIAATFAADTYTITASAGANGSIAPNGVTTVNAGDSQAYTIAADPNYHIADVLVDGNSVGAVASYTFTNVVANHTIAASFAIDTRTITATAGSGGAISPSGAVSVDFGSDQSFTITPDACDQITDVMVDDGSVGAVGTYTFTNVTANHTIMASFVPVNYTITASAGPNGSITPSGPIAVACGGSQSFTIAAIACYHVADVLVDGVSVGAVATYTMSNVTANHTIAASFAVDVQTIAASAGTGGSISPSGTVNVNCGSDQTFTITPDPCYAITDVEVNSLSAGAVSSYTFTNVTTSTNVISATFTFKTFLITAAAGANGTISPSGAITVGCGADQAFTITPDPCYQIANVMVDGSPIGAVASYTFTNVQAPGHTISATFVTGSPTIHVTAGDHGSIAPADSVVLTCGASQTFTITPDDCYKVADVLVDGGSVGAVTTYTFSNVAANHTLSASFALLSYTITASAGAGGTISPSGVLSVFCSGGQGYSILPAACYHIADVLVDGSSVGPVANYNFADVHANHTIAASFAVDTYTITASAAAGGSISPDGATVANCGGDQAYTITPDACHDIASVLVDGNAIGAVTSYTFTNITANHTIAASFTVHVETITASAGVGGSISPSGAVSVNCGDNQAFTIAADACHDIGDVLVDGNSVGAVASYSFTNVTTSHTIAASFTVHVETIAASAGAGGSISPSGAVSVNCGDNQVFTITADACQSIADVLVDGASVGAVATYTFANVTANHTIAASFVAVNYTIAASAGPNGSISPSGTVNVNCGGTQTFTITPNSCYHVADVLVDNGSVGAVGTYTFTSVGANHTIAASFSITTYTLTASAGANGSISPSGATVADCGSSPAFTITPDPCYHVADVLVDGNSVGAVATYTFGNVGADHTIAASFAIDTYTITASAGANGSLSPDGLTSVNCGASQAYTITPIACYEVADVLVDSGSVGAVTSYTFTNAHANHTISATFVQSTLAVTASAGPNGSISPSGAVSVSCGNPQAFTIAANACYHIADVLVDGNSVGAVGSYTFASVTTARTIAATFAIDTYTITASLTTNGSISPSGASIVNCGSSPVYTITPVDCYVIQDVVVDDVSVGAVATYTFNAVGANHTIAASFVLGSQSIVASAGAGGSISPSGTTTLGCGGSQAYTITADACNSIQDVLVDGVSVGAVATYTFGNVTANHTIAASFAGNTYTIATSAGPGGAIAPAGPITVACSGGQGFSTVPDACFQVADVLVDGSSVGPVSNYNFADVQANHTIAATFTQVFYSIATSTGPGGIIVPLGTVTLPAVSEEFTGAVLPAGWSSFSWPDGSGAGGTSVSGGVMTVNGARANPEPYTGGSSRSLEFVATFAAEPFQSAGLGSGNQTQPGEVFGMTPYAVFSTTSTGTALYTRVFDGGVGTADFQIPGSLLGTPHRYRVAWNPGGVDFWVDGTMVHTEPMAFAGSMRPAFSDITLNATALAVDWVRDTPLPVACGTNAAFAITPDPCYAVADVKVDGGSVGALGSYTFNDVQANHVLTATFALNTYAIVASAGAGGTISPDGTVNPACGSSQPYTITADACHTIADVLVDGVSIGAVGTYTFGNIVANHTIAASFNVIPYTITASAGAGGTISPDGGTSVNCGGSHAYTIAADACHTIADVLVDGVSVGAVGTYNFTNITANHTIAASFNIIPYTITASAGTGGTISPNGATVVNCGGSQAYTIAADACYIIQDVLVDGVSVGAVATYTFGNVTANHTIAASFAVIPYTITASAGAGGTISPNGGTSVNCGAPQAYTIAADACHTIGDVLVDGVSVGAVATYTFTSVTANHTIAASFNVIPYTITASAGAGGTISPNGATVVNCGGSQAYTIAADACQSIADVLVDGVSVGAVATYTFANVTANHTIAASFAIIPYTITASAGAGGTISPNGGTSVNCGGSQAYTIAADACYTIGDVLVDGVSVGAVGTYTFGNVAANHTIAASFNIIPYTITASAGAGGTISPNGGTSVNCGGSQAYTIAADACYTIGDVLVDGVSVGAVATYTFASVTANHTIAASFNIIPYTITASAGAGGTISPNGATVVNCGGSQAYTIAADACYTIQDVLVDGVSVTAVSTYTFTNVTANHTIAASFVLGNQTITASAGPGGSISPSGAVSVACGGTQAFTIAADACHTIADVLVDGVSVGAVGTYTFSGVNTNRTIAASFNVIPYTITASAGTGGTISPNGATVVNCGGSQAYTIAADACYTIGDVLVDGVSVGAVGTYTFASVAANHTIAASFNIIPYTITASAGTGGTISPNGGTSVNCGGSQAYTIAADACYTIGDVLVDGVSVGAVATYTFASVTANHTIAASFSVIPYTITASAGAGGTISPNGATVVNCGGSQAYTIAADACYTIGDVLVDGVSVGAVGTYTFASVAANHTIAASFNVIPYTITASAGAGGTISPNGATVVNCGGSQAYTIAADACYTIQDVLVDGVSVSAVATYTFTNVTANHTIAANFVLGNQTITASAGPGGSISPSGAVSVACGGTQAFTIAADACHTIADVLVDGVSVGAVGTYTFSGVNTNRTIAASFNVIPYAITASAGTGGTISPNGATVVNCGGSQAYTIAADACYTIGDVLVDGVSVGAVGTYTFASVAANHTIAASFNIIPYTITASAGTGGTISPNGATVVNCGGSQAYAITANGGFAILDVLVDGVSVGAVGTYTFTNVAANHTIAASFAVSAYTITASAGPNGSITPSGAVPVASGGSQTFTIAANACYTIADVLVDGVSVGAIATYTFVNVTANHTIAASFSAISYTITASAGANGTITPSGAVAAGCGANQTFAIAANGGFSIADVVVDGVSVGAIATYTFGNVQANHTIAASFVALGPTITRVFAVRADSSNGGTRFPIPGTAGPWADLTGHAHTAALAGLATSPVSGWQGDGTVGSPYRLELNGVSQYATVTASIPELQTVGPVTAEMWFKPNHDVLTGTATYDLLDWLQADDRGMSIAVGNGNLLIGLADWVPVAPVSPDQWMHVAVTKDATGQNVYVNGVLSYTNADAYNGKQSTPISIGASSYHFITGSNTYSDFFKGAIGQVQIYTGAMSAAQVLARFNADKALYLPTPDLPVPVRVTSLDAAKANGAGPYTVPGATSPWVDLIVPTTSATLTNFNGTATSGWQGNGTPANPYRLKFDGTNDVCVIPAQTVTDLNNAHANSAELWFQTPATVSGATIHYLLEWLAGTATANGMSVSIFNSQLQVKIASTGWQACAAVVPNTWYHVIVAKQPGQARVYLNGTRVFTSNFVNFSAPWLNVTIGASAFRGNGSFGEYWGGSIAQAHFWKGAVTDSIDRLVYAASAPDFAQLVAVDDAAPTELQLAGMRPNPATGPLNVAFSLPTSDPATLEMLDVTGRVVRSQAVGRLGAGHHFVSLGRGNELSAGIYWLRLSQGSRTVTTKASVVH